MQLGMAFRRDPLGFLVRTAARYGDASTFTAGRRQFFLLNDPELIREVLVTKADQFTKSPALRQAKVSLGEGLLTSEGDFHKRQRRLSQPAFHPSRVAGYAEAMVRRGREAADRWRNAEVIELHAEMMRLTLRVVADTLFSASIDAEVDRIGQAMHVMVAMFTRARNPFAPLLNRLPLPSNYRFIRALSHVRGTVDRFIRENRAAGIDRGDLLSRLVMARDTEDDDSGMSDIQLRDELLTLFTAGHETTANALTFTWRLLASHPEVFAKLRAELDRELPGRDPSAEDVGRLVYTRAVIAESMRLFPPAWVLMREAKHEVVLGNGKYRLPALSISILSQWIVHRDPRWWTDAEKFLPERWLDEQAKEARPRHAYFPFGGGPRNCIGESFAWMEAILLLATTARTWRMRIVDDGPFRLVPTITLRPRDPVKMLLIQEGARTSPPASRL